MEYQVQEVPDTGSAGVFTYYIPDLQKTLAFMFSHDIRDPVSGCCGKFDVKLYHGQINADKDLYLKMKNDHPWDGDGEPQDRYLGSSFEAEGVMTTMPPNVKIFIH